MIKWLQKLFKPVPEWKVKYNDILNCSIIIAKSKGREAGARYIIETLPKHPELMVQGEVVEFRSDLITKFNL